MLPEVVKDNDSFKLVLSLDKPCPSLLLLFSDVEVINTEEDQEMENTKQVSFLLRNKEVVSVLVSKDDMKVRIQANTASAI